MWTANLVTLEFVGLFDAEVVGQVHIAVVEQTLSNAEVLAFVAVEHGNLAEVKRVEEIQRQAQCQKGSGDIPISARRNAPASRRQMNVAQKNQHHSPQRMWRPEQSQEGEEVGERITESEKAQSQQDGGQQGSALQALLELRPAVKEAIAEPSQNQPGNAEDRRAERPLQTIGSSRYDQA